MKKEIVLLIVLILGLSAYLAFQKTDKLTYALPTLERIAKKDMQKIVIENQGGAITLRQVENRWVVGDPGHPVDKNKTDGILKAIETLELTAMVAEAENYQRYDLSDEKKIHVAVWDDKGIRLAFDLGKTADTRRHSFIRLDKDKRIYQARGNFRNSFDVTAEVLRDKQVLAFDKGTIHQIALKRKDQSLTLFRQAPAAEDQTEETDDPDGQLPAPMTAETPAQWKTTAGIAADADEVDRLLSLLADLRCQRYLAPAAFDDPAYVVTLSGDREYVLSIYGPEKEEDNGFAAVSSLSVDPFVLPKWQVEKIMVDLEQIVTPPEVSEGK